MFSFLKRQRTPGWLAVCQRGELVDFAHIRRDGGVPVLASWSSLPAATSESRDPLWLQGQLKALGLDACRCTTLLSAGEYQLAQVEAPGVPDVEMKEALRWKLKDLVDANPEEATFDLLPVPESGAGRPRQLLLAVAANSVIAPIVQRFQAAGVDLEAIDLPELAQRNIAALFEDENRGLAFLVMYSKSSLLTFTHRGELFAYRRIEIGAEQFAQAGAERKAQLCERVVLEMQRSMDTVDRQFSMISLSQLIVALPPDTGLDEFFRNALYLPFSDMNLADKLDLSAFPALAEPEAQRTALLALGAALRHDEVPA